VSIPASWVINVRFAQPHPPLPPRPVPPHGIPCSVGGMSSRSPKSSSLRLSDLVRPPTAVAIGNLLAHHVTYTVFEGQAEAGPQPISQAVTPARSATIALNGDHLIVISDVILKFPRDGYAHLWWRSPTGDWLGAMDLGLHRAGEVINLRTVPGASDGVEVPRI
jgi:hypothetical protein